MDFQNMNIYITNRVNNEILKRNDIRIVKYKLKCEFIK